MTVVCKVERAEKEIIQDIFYPGNLVEIDDGGSLFILMVVKNLPEGVNQFSGVVLYTEEDVIEVGSVHEDWLKSKFKQFEGSINLIGSK